MKKLFTLLTLLTVPAMAQISFTTVSAPANNTAISSRSITYSGAMPSAGANLTWDYSALDFSSASPTTNTAYTNVSNSPRASSFPTASYYEVDASGGEIYYKVTANTIDILGNYSSANGGLTIVNSDPETTITVPFSYGDTQSDTYGGTYTSNSINVTKTGTVQVDYNGYGTLITSDGTFNNAPMVSLVADETHNFEVSPGVFFPVRIVSTTYSWSNPADLSFLFSIIKIETYNFGSLSSTSISALKRELVPTGLFNTAGISSVEIFPQPAKDQVTISAEQLNGSCVATVYNLSGEAVQTAELNAVNGQVIVDIQSLKKGLYMVELNNNGQLLRSKLIVQ